jgi:Bacterial Ig-like domain (group 3)
MGGTAVLAILVFVSAGALLAAGQTAVTTYHYDNNRTGWNQHETVLTPANVATSSFGLLQTVVLDDQVDAQPLVVPGVQITAGQFQGPHDVVYVATEHNTVYAIDVHTGVVLLSPNFGSPVPRPLNCNNNGPNVGINSTPVIDLGSNTLYVMMYTLQPGPAYYLHALDLGSLNDKVAPQLVTASSPLTDGTTFNFNATYQRQRPGLLLANGSVYAGFGSFCDLAPSLSRGWLLGWTAGSLAPFPSNQLLDQQATSPNTFFLSAIWMSGYGPAADDAGNILFVTGNSDKSGTTYDGVTNIQESVVKVSPTLTTVLDLFTPKNQATLDLNDSDFGAGGVLVLPDQPGPTPHLAVAAGKLGNMFLMNEDHLGGYSPTTNNVLGTYGIGPCWCGQSYFVDPVDGLGRVVSSGGRVVNVWKVQTSPAVALTTVATSPSIGGGQAGGFFTTISSNGNANPIIWAISHPTSATGAPISLFAFDPDSGSPMSVLFQGTAGAWPNRGGNANLVPVVANGLVFVASNQQLQIFGLSSNTTPTTTTLVSSMNPSVSGKPVAFTAVVSSTAGTPTGEVRYLNGTTVLTTLSLTAGSAKYTTSKLPPGANSITAVYEGDANYSSSTSAPVNQFVLKATTTTLSSSPNPSVYRQTVVFTATVTSSFGTPPDGETVTFKQGATILGTGTLSGGTATLPISTLGAGTKWVTAVYAGDSTFASSSKTMSQVVSKATTTTTLVSSLNPSESGQSVTFTASVAPQFSGTPTGYVTFYDGTTVLKTVYMSGGAASFKTSTLATGTHTITATYNGNANFVGSSASLTQTVD